MTDFVTDARGTTIREGSRVLPFVRDGKTMIVGGLVTRVTPFDLDWDDDAEAPCQHGPRIYVTYDDGVEDDYLATPTLACDEFVCDEVEIEVTDPAVLKSRAELQAVFDRLREGWPPPEGHNQPF